MVGGSVDGTWKRAVSRSFESGGCAVVVVVVVAAGKSGGGVAVVVAVACVVLPELREAQKTVAVGVVAAAVDTAAPAGIPLVLFEPHCELP